MRDMNDGFGFLGNQCGHVMAEVGMGQMQMGWIKM
jgi:hypothetical protein